MGTTLASLHSCAFLLHQMSTGKALPGQVKVPRLQFKGSWMKPHQGPWLYVDSSPSRASGLLSC